MTYNESYQPKEIVPAKAEFALLIPIEAYRKIMAYATICDLEISGFGEIAYNPEKKEFTVGEVFLLDQEVSGTNTHLDEEAISKFNFQQIKKGKTQLPQLWWHSHVNMEAFFSGTDEDTSVDLKNDTFSISLVVNKRFEMKARMYIYEESIVTCLGETIEDKSWIDISDLPVRVQLESPEVPVVLQKEVEKKVRKHTPVVSWDKKDKKEKGKVERFGFGEDDVAMTPEYSTYYENINRNRNFTRVFQLPKDRNAALDRITRLGLLKAWDQDVADYVYVDPENGDTWLDNWKVVSGDLESTD